MKKIILPIIAILALASCKEQNALIDLNPDRPLKIDSSYTVSNPVPDPKKVLLEDLTGVRCINCPNAEEEGEGIQAAHPGRVIMVSEHVTSLAEPLSTSKYDFRSQDATNLLALFGGEPNALPQGIINRYPYASTTNTPYYNIYKSWDGIVAQELDTASPVNISFEKLQYNGADNSLEGKIKITYTSAVNVPTSISVMLTESGMKDVQEISHTPGVDTAYIFKNALRKVVRPLQGQKLSDNASKGQVYEVSFSTLLSKNWIPQNMTAVAIVSRMKTGDIRVLQAEEKNVQ
jgi:hypothetical protein